eukprot:925008_1
MSFRLILSFLNCVLLHSSSNVHCQIGDTTYPLCVQTLPQVGFPCCVNDVVYACADSRLRHCGKGSFGTVYKVQPLNAFGHRYDTIYAMKFTGPPDRTHNPNLLDEYIVSRTMMYHIQTHLPPEYSQTLLPTIRVYDADTQVQKGNVLVMDYYPFGDLFGTRNLGASAAYRQTMTANRDLYVFKLLKDISHRHEIQD